MWATAPASRCGAAVAASNPCQLQPFLVTTLLSAEWWILAQSRWIPCIVCFGTWFKLLLSSSFCSRLGQNCFQLLNKPGMSTADSSIGAAGIEQQMVHVSVPQFAIVDRETTNSFKALNQHLMWCKYHCRSAMWVSLLRCFAASLFDYVTLQTCCDAVVACCEMLQNVVQSCEHRHDRNGCVYSL